MSLIGLIYLHIHWPFWPYFQTKTFSKMQKHLLTFVLFAFVAVGIVATSEPKTEAPKEGKADTMAKKEPAPEAPKEPQSKKMSLKEAILSLNMYDESEGTLTMLSDKEAVIRMSVVPNADDEIIAETVMSEALFTLFFAFKDTDLPEITLTAEPFEFKTKKPIPNFVKTIKVSRQKALTVLNSYGIKFFADIADETGFQTAKFEQVYQENLEAIFAVFEGKRVLIDQDGNVVK